MKRMWRAQSVAGIDCGDDVAAWISNILYPDGSRSDFCRLLWQSPEIIKSMPRRVNLDDNSGCTLDEPMEDVITTYGDLTPYMLMHDASVKDLDRRIEKTSGAENNSVSMDIRRFRPNIVVETDQEAFDEDDWYRIKIGASEFTNVKPCTRCVLTTVDPDTAQRHPANEPLKTLRKYRLEPRYEQSPKMGINLVLDNPKQSGESGHIAVGDDVYVKYKE